MGGPEKNETSKRNRDTKRNRANKTYQANCVCNTMVTYNKSNKKFSKQGAVSGRARINRLKYNNRVINNKKIEIKNNRIR